MFLKEEPYYDYNFDPSFCNDFLNDYAAERLERNDGRYDIWTSICDHPLDTQFEVAI